MKWYERFNKLVGWGLIVGLTKINIQTNQRSQYAALGTLDKIKHTTFNDNFIQSFQSRESK